MQNGALYLEIINHMSEGAYFVDAQRVIRFWNRGAEEITGYPAEEIVGKCCSETPLKHIDIEGRPLCQLSCPLYDTIKDHSAREARVFTRHREGYRFPLRVRTQPIFEDGKLIGAISIFNRETPVVYKDELIDRLSDIAIHDPLTGLPNRRYLEAFLRHRFEEFQHFGRRIAVLFADVDNFARFNNEHGHEAGDVVLRNIANTIQYNTRESDLFGRWGGEEFVGIFDLGREGSARAIAERYLNLVRSTDVGYRGAHLNLTISVGVAVARERDDMQSLMDRADRLMYRSKALGKDRVCCDEDE